MQEKLIITLWKAQLKQIDKESMIACRLLYNNQEKLSKTSSQAKNMAWKQTLIFALGKKQSPLKIEFLTLKDGQQIHFAKDIVLQSLRIGKSILNIDIDNSYRGSLPCKLDIYDQKQENIGKLFIEYEILKTQIAYTVEKQMDYIYSLKMSNFQVSFVRNLKKSPLFYLHFNIDNKLHKEDLPFQKQKNGIFVYNYPVRLYMKKQMQMEIELHIKQQEQYELDINEYITQTSFNKSLTSQEKSLKSSTAKKQKLLLQLGKDKIFGIFDLLFKKDCKVTKRIPLTTMIKSQKREIGAIQFQLEVNFRSKQELQELQEQKKGINPEKDQRSLEKKKNLVKQTNGLITVNSILGKLELFNESIVDQKNISIQVKLGKHAEQSSILQNPGKELIIIDTFVYKRTWQETMKFTVNLYNNHSEKCPTFFSEVNLRELFQIGRYVSRKIKLKDENKNYAGELILDMIYKEIQQKKVSPSPSPSLKQSLHSPSETDSEVISEVKHQLKRDQIEERIRRRQQQKQRSKQIYSMSTLAILQENEIMLPPLKSISRVQTISPPKNQKYTNALINMSGNVKFPKAQRFTSAQKPGYESFTYVRESEFGKNKSKGPYIGYGQKSDFVKPYVKNPGVGRYEIPTVWDKYK